MFRGGVRAREPREAARGADEEAFAPARVPCGDEDGHAVEYEQGEVRPVQIVQNSEQRDEQKARGEYEGRGAPLEECVQSHFPTAFTRRRRGKFAFAKTLGDLQGLESAAAKKALRVRLFRLNMV